MLQLLDISLTVVHVAIIAFNVFGWIPNSTRKAHLFAIVLTAASWLLLGIWFGIGYCPFTDWQWRVKEKLGETNLPGNFIEYFAERITDHDFHPQFINDITGITFIVVALLSIYRNFKRSKRK